jgi:hypothetical protein
VHFIVHLNLMQWNVMLKESLVGDPIQGHFNNSPIIRYTLKLNITQWEGVEKPTEELCFTV